MISPEDKIALYNSKIRRVVPLKEVVQHLHLDGVGEQGPQGLQGIQGPKGDKGDTGDVGPEGPQGIQGTQGIQGPAGNGFSLAETYASVAEMNADFNNSEVPVNSFVLINSSDEDNGKLFLKNDTEYVFQSQLSGVKGDTGPQGTQGPSGATGLTGPQGLIGPQGERGLQGPQGPVGPQGLTGPQGLKGNKGDDGLAGERGPQGVQGVQGTQGVKGDKGEIGLQGAQGPQGVAGPEGPKGDMGNGFSISKVYPSIAGMNADFSNADVALNSFVLINSSDSDNGKLFVKGQTSFAYQSQLAGVKGDKGDRGLQGVQGVAGAQGVRGIQGEQGLAGAQGERGLQGLQGIAGPQGIRGEKGDTGETGARGLQGLQGLQGPQGERGLTGPKGDKGEGVDLVSSDVTISSALTSRGGRLSDVVLQKQGIFTKLSLSFYNGNTTQQSGGTRLIIGTLPEGFRPSKVVHTMASDNGGSAYPRHAILIDSSGNITWVPQNSTGYFTMNFQVVF